VSPRRPSQREYILSICAERGLVGRDAETAVDAYLAGHEDDADGGRVKAILKAFVDENGRGEN
jgi:hypothetical protein